MGGFVVSCGCARGGGGVEAVGTAGGGRGHGAVRMMCLGTGVIVGDGKGAGEAHRLLELHNAGVGKVNLGQKVRFDHKRIPVDALGKFFQAGRDAAR